MTQPINLVDLDYDTLKANLVTYLKSTDVGQQFDLDSPNTAIDMINGLFTYNTLIWLHYLHILNNESFISSAKNVESVSKLLQVTGFTPPTKKSALALVTFIKTDANLAQIDRFATMRARNSNNNQINFYHVGPRTTIDTASTFEFYAGTKLVKQLAINVDLDNQEFQIADKDVDIRTVLISVNGTYWTNYTNEPVVGTTEESQIFFLVKKGDYYYVKFGKNLQSEDINSIGKSIISTDAVLLSYVVASGQQGNGVVFNSITQFSSNNGLAIPAATVSSTTSSGGFDAPDINYLKYLGPRYYGYSSLVTKSDYEAAIAASGYVPDETTIGNQIAVFDGQDYNNFYGKIYYSIIGLGADSSQVTSLSSKLSAKSIVGLAIEYLESDDFTGKLSLAITYDSRKTNKSASQLRSELIVGINNAYGNNQFNHAISKADLITLVTDYDPGLSVTDTNITFVFDKVVDLDVSRNIRFYHAITNFTTTLVSTNLSTSQVKFANTTTNVPELNGYKYIAAYLNDGTLVNSKVGVFNPTTGHILFYDTVDPSATFTISITANATSIVPQNNMAVEYEVDTLTVT
jgi:hypothetical protein